METHVYINDQEACSKAADGKSAAAFPDPCWSPPGPPAGPVVIPYPNTAHAKTLSKGTATVFICNSMVATEDKSYFASSEGDDGATDNFPKGVATNAKNGKAYFQTWSKNVFFEGFGVPRHEDLMTHNHGSQAGNTPPHYYVDTKAENGVCKKDIEKMKKACKHDENHQTALEKMLGKEKLKKFETLMKKSGLEAADWMKSHCAGMWVKPMQFDKLSKDLKDIANLKETINSKIGELIKEGFWDVAGNVGSGLVAAGGEIAVNKLENAAIRHGAAGVAIVFPPVEVVVQGVASVITVGDAIFGVVEGAYKTIGAGIDVAVINSAINQIPDEIEKSLQQMIDDPKLGMTNFMSAAARLEPCLRAKKCILVPYKVAPEADKEDEDEQGQNTEIRSPYDPLSGHGCCPGQTGHHLIPGAAIRNNENCKGYNHNEAPAVCLEGTNGKDGWGSHGKVQQSYREKIENYREPNMFKFGNRDKISYEDARDKAVDSLVDSFPESFCNKKCLRAQLDKYYENLCNPKVIDAKTGYGPTKDFGK